MKYLKDFRIAIILLVLLIVLVIARYLKRNYYELSVQETYERSLKADEFISYDEYKSTGENYYYLVDLRNEEAYTNWHIENAVNIPFNDLLKKVDLKDKNLKLLIYSDRITKTVKAKIILNQMGYLNVYYLDFPDDNRDSRFEGLNSISLDEEFKYKFRPDTTIRPE